MNPLLLLEQQPALAPVIGVFAGVALAVSPLAWPMAVTTLATGVATSDDGRVPWRPVVAVGVGITVVYVALGAAVGMIDVLVRDVLGASAGAVQALLAALVVATGVLLIARPSAACRVWGQRPAGSSAGAVALGMALSAITCPACAGVVTGVAVSAAASWGTTTAVLAMLGLGIGHTLALLLLARLARPFIAGGTRMHVVHRCAGIALVLAGLFFAWQASGSGLTIAPTLP